MSATTCRCKTNGPTVTERDLACENQAHSAQWQQHEARIRDDGEFVQAIVNGGLAHLTEQHPDEEPGPAAPCPRCGGPNGAHGVVHVRHGNGGGSNRPCPDAPTMALPTRDELVQAFAAVDGNQRSHWALLDRLYGPFADAVLTLLSRTSGGRPSAAAELNWFLIRLRRHVGAHDASMALGRQVSAEEMAAMNAWRSYFLATDIGAEADRG